MGGEGGNGEALALERELVMQLRIELTEKELKDLVVVYLRNKLGDINLTVDKVRIEVKSKHNYKAEWEEASFRAVYDVSC